MNKLTILLKPLAWSVPFVLAAVVTGCGGGSSGSGSQAMGSATPVGAGTGRAGLGAGPSAVNLGTAIDFAVLSEAGITNVPTSAITGDVGTSPITGAAIGVTCVEVTGTIYSVDAAGPLPCRVTDATKLGLAVGDKNTAYTNAAGRAPDYTELRAGNIGGLNLGPATYRWSTPVLIPTSVTLTGGPNDVWIFQIAQGLTVSSGVEIILAGGADPKNIFWQTFAAADLGTTSKFKGVLLSQTSIVMKSSATIDGRLFAGTSVALDANRVTEPAP